jgi:enterochelin esterase-like enzyme
VPEVPYLRQPNDFSEPVTYAYGADSFPQDGVPRGTIAEYEWNESTAFPGTHRRFWVYVPEQYNASDQASLMVFQDGWMYLDPDGEIRAGTVFDNLIHRMEMPITIAVFVDPGEPGNRNIEYDAFNDAYAMFLLEEILPPVLDQYAVSPDPDRWAICGGSSGGTCALTAAWMRPDRFRRVVSFLGSFPQLEGGDRYPQLIAEDSPRPLRIFLQAATRDLGWNEPEWNWFASNLRVGAALAERGYDLRLVMGDGGHGPNHAGAILPDVLRWLWR